MIKSIFKYNGVISTNLTMVTHISNDIYNLHESPFHTPAASPAVAPPLPVPTLPRASARAPPPGSRPRLSVPCAPPARVSRHFPPSTPAAPAAPPCPRPPIPSAARTSRLFSCQSKIPHKCLLPCQFLAHFSSWCTYNNRPCGCRPYFSELCRRMIN